MARTKRHDRRILVREDGTTYPDRCHVYGSKRVMWYSESGPWTMQFKGKHTPFSKTTFTIGRGGGKTGWSSGAKGKKGEDFKYTVSGQGKTVDPDIIIR